jgi:hypothetical protein
MSFHSSIGKTIQECENIFKVGVQKFPTKYILSLYRRSNDHMILFMYNGYNTNNEFEKLSKFNTELKKILNTREHIKRKNK